MPLLLGKKENYSFDLMEIVDEDFSYLKRNAFNKIYFLFFENWLKLFDSTLAWIFHQMNYTAILGLVAFSLFWMYDDKSCVVLYFMLTNASWGINRSKKGIRPIQTRMEKTKRVRERCEKDARKMRERCEKEVGMWWNDILLTKSDQWQIQTMLTLKI